MSNDKFSEAGKCKKMWSYCLQSDEWWAFTSRMWHWKMIAASYANILPIFSILFWYKSLRLKAWDRPRQKDLSFKAFSSHSKRMTFRTSWLKITIFAENWCLLFLFFKEEKSIGQWISFEMHFQERISKPDVSVQRSTWGDSASMAPCPLLPPLRTGCWEERSDL